MRPLLLFPPCLLGPFWTRLWEPETLVWPSLTLPVPQASHWPPPCLGCLPGPAFLPSLPAVSGLCSILELCQHSFHNTEPHPGPWMHHVPFLKVLPVNSGSRIGWASCAGRSIWADDLTQPFLSLLERGMPWDSSRFLWETSLSIIESPFSRHCVPFTADPPCRAAVGSSTHCPHSRVSSGNCLVS